MLAYSAQKQPLCSWQERSLISYKWAADTVSLPERIWVFSFSVSTSYLPFPSLLEGFLSRTTVTIPQYLSVPLSESILANNFNNRFEAGQHFSICDVLVEDGRELWMCRSRTRLLVISVSHANSWTDTYQMGCVVFSLLLSDKLPFLLLCLWLWWVTFGRQGCMSVPWAKRSRAWELWSGGWRLDLVLAVSSWLTGP